MAEPIARGATDLNVGRDVARAPALERRSDREETDSPTRTDRVVTVQISDEAVLGAREGFVPAEGEDEGVRGEDTVNPEITSAREQAREIEARRMARHFRRHFAQRLNESFATAVPAPGSNVDILV